MAANSIESKRKECQVKDDPYTKQAVALIEGAMKYAGVSYPQVADMLGQPSRQALFKKVKNGSMKLTTFMAILHGLGLSIRIEKKNGEVVPIRPAVGDRVRRVVRGHLYDTKHCCPVADNFFQGEDGAMYHGHIAEELYYDPETKKYLLVHYSDGAKIKIRNRTRFPWVEVIEPEDAQKTIIQFFLK